MFGKRNVVQFVETQYRTPDYNTKCEVITPGGETRELIYDMGLWWLPDKSMYVYFTPTYWRPVAE